MGEFSLRKGVRDCRITVKNLVRNLICNPAWYYVIGLRYVGQEMLSFVIAAKRLDAGDLVRSKGFQQMIDASGAARYGDSVNIQQFVKFHYSHTGRDPPLEDKSWDLLLFRKWLKSRERNPEVCPVIIGKEGFIKQTCASERDRVWRLYISRRLKFIQYRTGVWIMP